MGLDRAISEEHERSEAAAAGGASGSASSAAEGDGNLAGASDGAGSRAVIRNRYLIRPFRNAAALDATTSTATEGISIGTKEEDRHRQGSSAVRQLPAVRGLDPIPDRNSPPLRILAHWRESCRTGSDLLRSSKNWSSRNNKRPSLTMTGRPPTRLHPPRSATIPARCCARPRCPRPRIGTVQADGSTAILATTSGMTRTSPRSTSAWP